MLCSIFHCLDDAYLVAGGHPVSGPDPNGYDPTRHGRSQYLVRGVEGWNGAANPGQCRWGNPAGRTPSPAGGRLGRFVRWRIHFHVESLPVYIDLYG